MRTLQILRTTALSLIAASAMAVSAHATDTDSDTRRADRLYEQAEAMEQQPTSHDFSRHLRRTARLYQASAELRADSDPRKIESLYRAGVLLTTQEPERARKLISEAAELALSHGDVVRTAHFCLDAAWILTRDNHVTEEAHRMARSYLERARLLADSPAIDAEARAGILHRIKNSALAATVTATR
jgi:hypothetical protein